MKTISISKIALAVLAAFGLYLAAGAQSDQLVNHVAALKQSMARSKQALKPYQWTQTTALFHHGEEVSQRQYLARYGPDGTVQKTLVSATPEKAEHGLREHVIEKKRGEIKEYLDRAESLIKMYIPPDPDRIQLVKDAGNVSLTPVDPGKRVRVTFRNYLLPGDALAVDIDPTNNRIFGATVNTYLDKPDQTVDIAFQFGTLPDGTMYPSIVDFSTHKKDLALRTTNTNYRRITS